MSDEGAGGRRITLVISHLQVGGAERVLVELANHWAARGWTVTIVDFAAPDTAPAFEVDPRVVEVSLDLQRDSYTIFAAIKGNAHRISVLRRAIRATRPDVVLSLMNRTNVLTILALTGTRIPVLVCEHTAPKGTLSLGWSLLRELAYRRARAVVMLTGDALAQMSAGIRRRGRVIPNPLPAGFSDADASVDPGTNDQDHPLLLSLGRLAPEKGFDVLIQAFARIAGAWPTAKLVIWGEGEERGPLELLRRDAGLDDRVDLPGATTDPARELLTATIFVLPSRLEGLPMTLLEAMAMGRPVIASDCDFGPRDVVRDGIDGLLVPPEDPVAMATAIDALLRDPDKRRSLGERSLDVRQRFAMSAISQQWDELFDEVTR